MTAIIHTINAGDVINVQGHLLEVVGDADNAPYTFGVALRPHIARCAACGQNDAQDEFPFCITCLNDAVTLTMLREVIEDNLGDRLRQLNEVIEWDHNNASSARNAGQQYIDMASNAWDEFSGFTVEEMGERFASLMMQYVIPPIRERGA